MEDKIAYLLRENGGIRNKDLGIIIYEGLVVAYPPKIIMVFEKMEKDKK